jgi:hypothetical protein
MSTPESSNTNQYEDSEFTQMLAQLSDVQLKYVDAMLRCPNKKQAAQEIGVRPNTVYKWPAYVDEVVHLIRSNRLQAIKAMREQSAFKAMRVKLEGLDSSNPWIRQRVASEILAADLDAPASARSTARARNTSQDQLPLTTDNQHDPATWRHNATVFLENATPTERAAFLEKYEECTSAFEALNTMLEEFHHSYDKEALE